MVPDRDVLLRTIQPPARFRTRGVPRASHQVIVDQPARLHECVANCGADELESALEQITAERVTLGCSRGYFGGRAALIFARPASDEAPDVAIETTELVLHLDERLRIPQRRGDLQSIADDTGVGHQRRDFVRVVARDLLHIEVVEGAAIVFALVQNRRPAEAGLRAFQDQQLKPVPVILQRHAPFLIVVGQIDRSFRPGTRARQLHSRKSEEKRSEPKVEIRKCGGGFDQY